MVLWGNRLLHFLFLFLKILFSFTNTSEPPVMIVEPRDDVVMESYTSEEINLQCELSRSGGKVRWFKDGQMLEDSQNIRLVSEGPYRRLDIPSSRVEDSGEYVCETDGDSVFFQLTVKGKTESENKHLQLISTNILWHLKKKKNLKRYYSVCTLIIYDLLYSCCLRWTYLN